MYNKIAEMNTEERNILEFAFPAYNEIPDVGLYLKQVVKYINETLSPWFDITVTETMLSNYVKMHMIPNAIKKQYYRNQITSMIFIVLAKTVVSLDNIQVLLKLREEKYDAKAAYDYFCSYFILTLRRLYGEESPEVEYVVNAIIENMKISITDDNNSELEMEISLFNNVIIAMVQKYHIDSCFRALIQKDIEK